MSSPSIMPGAKAENAVYLAFGLTLTLYLIKVTSPVLFDIEHTRELVAMAAFGASIIGAVFFYAQLDRIFVWALKRLTMRRYGTWLGIAVVHERLYYRVWQTAMMEYWPTVMEECENSVDSVLHGADLYDDVWRIRGAAYFAVGVCLLGSVLDYSSDITVGWVILSPCSQLLVIMIAIPAVVVFFSVEYAARALKRAACVAYVKSFTDVRTAVKARMAFGQEVKTHLRDDFKPTISGTDATADIALSELGQMIATREWNRLCRRAEFLFESIKTFLATTGTHQLLEQLILYSLESEIRQHSSRLKKWGKQMARQVQVLESAQSPYQIRTPTSPLWELHWPLRHPRTETRPERKEETLCATYTRLVNRVHRLNADEWRKHLQEKMADAFWHGHEKDDIIRCRDQLGGIARILLSWYKSGVEPASYAAFGIAPQIGNDDDAKSVFTELNLETNEHHWSYLESSHLERMKDVGLSAPGRYFMAVPFAYTRRGAISGEEKQRIMRFAIMNRQYTGNLWERMFRERTTGPDAQQLLELVKPVIRNKETRTAFKKILSDLSGHEDQAVKSRAQEVLKILRS